MGLRVVPCIRSLALKSRRPRLMARAANPFGPH
jgi:hypothetical protein